MATAQEGTGRTVRPTGDGQSASAGNNNSRSPSKVAFKEQREEYEYRSHYIDSASSDSELTSCSSSDYSSGSPDRDRRSYRRRSDRDRHRRHSSGRHCARDRGPRRSRRELQGTSSSSSYDAHAATTTATAAAATAATATAAPGSASAHVANGSGSVHPCQLSNQPLSMALVPPPGSGPFPTSPPAAPSNPTRAYTSPRSAHDPPPTLLLSSYGGHHPNCPAAVVYGAAPTFPGGAAAQPPGPASLLAPMQMLAMNGAVATPPAPGPGSPTMQYNGCVMAAAAAPPPPPPPQVLPLPPPPVALPLALPDPMLQLPYAVHQQQQAGLSMVYDETMQEVVLADAVMVKELAKQGHGLAPLADAYRTKLAALQAAVNGPLLAKREALMQQHARLAARAGEVAAQRAALEREVAVLTEDMVGRIRGAESLKQSVLAREQSDVGAQLDAIQRLLGDIMAASAAGPVDFLNAYSRLTDTCHRLVSKPFKQVVDVAVDDLPAEAAVYRDLAASHEALTQLLGVKDQMISHLLKERDALRDELRQVVERYSTELSALESQCQGYYQRLMALGGTATTTTTTAATTDATGRNFSRSP
ncbi:hypothetical protein Vretimale_18232 [Volvox reticuliferus]|uniref:Uncharacterized protein n=1 Tax=Volvox reticuliferus TaxID=1737510 RepID=A0A8J4CWX4_9CHLO|nr:hypothetical protein Vretifemale_18006 [Volvox reticuliferus]GIM15457.1 hypothetical protein Vretimale_18232 [Volvox reticuliferus]